jgi:hypothetical protein
MIASFPIRRAKLFVGFCLSVAPAMLVELHAAETEAGRRDFSAEAEAAHQSDQFESLRDPELRRHYLDQMESRKWSDLERVWSGNAELVPGDAIQRPDKLPPEIRHLQEALGGSQVDRFPSLRNQPVENEPQRPWASRSAIAPPEAICALRDGAAKLDEIANRLEQLELYAQADAIREQAQRLRLDARGATISATPAEPTRQPIPVKRFDPGPVTPHDLNSSMPRLEPSRATRGLPPTPTNPKASPLLEPVPQPEIPSNPPKPQPLLDSPESPPRPDIEVEG